MFRAKSLTCFDDIGGVLNMLVKVLVEESKRKISN